MAPKPPSGDRDDKYDRWRKRFQEVASENFGYYLLVARLARELGMTVDEVLKWPFTKFCTEYTLRLWLLK